MNKFPIGFWNYTSITLQSAKDVRDWADLGMTMANSPEYFANCGEAEKQNMLSILDACAEAGIKVILCDHRARWGTASTDPDAYRAQFAEALKDFGDHPAVFGFHVGDEPTNEQTFADACAAHKIQLEMAPHLTPHLNFLPYWQGQEETVLKEPTFVDWARRMKEQADLRVLCYDCYSQMNPGDEGVDQYYTNLRKFSEAADDTGIIPWTTLLSVGHFRYRCPSEDDMRWQLNTAVASGMKGILWFFIYERVPTSNYRTPPIDEFGERTEAFSHMSRVNRHFLHHAGDFFMNAKHLATYHVGRAYGGYPLFEANKTDDILLDVTCTHNLPAVLGLFEFDGHKYCALVNNSTTESGLFHIHIPKDKTLYRYTWNHAHTDVRFDHWDAAYSETDTTCVCGDWLAPGQMKIYQYR